MIQPVLGAQFVSGAPLLLYQFLEADGSVVAEGGIGTGLSSGWGGDAHGQISGTAMGGTGTGSGTGSGGDAAGAAGGSATASGGTGTSHGSGTGGDAAGQSSGIASGGTGTGVGSGSGGDATGGMADATVSGGTGTGHGSGSGGTASGHEIEPGPLAWWVRPSKRTWIVKPRRAKIMPLPEKDPEEVKTVTFDFSGDIATLTEATVTATAVSGLPDDASAMLGAASIDGPRVNQRVRGGRSGTDYLLRCKGTDADGEVHVAVALLPVKIARPC